MNGGPVWQCLWTIVILGADGLRSAYSHSVDGWSVAFAALAMFPAIQHFAKSMDLDFLKGHFTISTRDVAAAASEITGVTVQNVTGTASVTQGPQRVEGTGTVAVPPESKFTILYQVDPNIALVSLRIEIERRVVELAQLNNIQYPAPLTRIVDELIHREVLDPQYAQGLLSLIRLGNQAAHGAKIEPGAAQYAQELEPGILASLDRKISDLKGKAK